MRSKYGNKKIVVGSEKFDSKKEYARYRQLLLLERSGMISDLRRQVSYTLIPAQYGEKSVRYIADFVYKEGGKTIVEDVKGVKTAPYIIKRKLFKDRYYGSGNVEFRET